MNEFQKFIEWRNNTLPKLAGSKAPYQAFDNKTAKVLVDKKPLSLEDLQTIKGFPVGGKRMEKYGQHIVNYFLKSKAYK